MSDDNTTYNEDAELRHDGGPVCGSLHRLGPTCQCCEGGGALFARSEFVFTGRRSARHSSIYTKATAHLYLELERTAKRTTTRVGVKGVFELDAK